MPPQVFDAFPGYSGTVVLDAYIDFLDPSTNNVPRTTPLRVISVQAGLKRCE
jgi:hypothetical protein